MKSGLLIYYNQFNFVLKCFGRETILLLGDTTGKTRAGAWTLMPTLGCL